MPKERISHFTTKGIAVTSKNSATIREDNISSSTVQEYKIQRKTDFVGRIKKISKERLAIYHKESEYATKPAQKTSKLIQTQREGEENADTLRVLRTRLEDRFTQLAKIDEEILQEMRERDIPQEEMDEEYETIQEYRDKWNELSSTNIGVATHDDNRSMVSTSRSDKSRYKLPKLKLMEFSGSPREWLQFWSQFKGIHEDGNISSEGKFQYLIQATQSESAARRVVSSFPPTAENYTKAIEHLKARFGKENVLVEVYVRDLLKLVLTNTDGKQRLSLSTLYDKLETQLRALESLGVTSDKYAAMLYPLVESSLSEDVLVAWERTRNQRGGTNENDDQLQQLMIFLRGEVESGIRLQMAKHGITSDDDDWYSPPKKQRQRMFDTVTTTDLLNKESQSKCLFCGRFHQSQFCTNAERLTLKERYAKIREARKCFKCLKGNHFARDCKVAVNCLLCKGTHYKIFCNKIDKKPLKEINAYSAYDDVNEIILQTLVVNVNGPIKKQALRTLVDCGSGRSYITSPAVKNFGLQSVGTIELAHSLFGGHVTRVKKHSIYVVDVSNIDNSFQKRYQLIEVDKICGNIDPTPKGPWTIELSRRKIQLSDTIEKECPINMLFGANVISKLYTGNIYETESGPVAFETRFGWTLMGSIADKSCSNNVLLVHSFYVSAASIQDLWNLDVIGIHDPVEEKSKIELSKSALVHFENNITRLHDGRYEVALPWIEGHQPVAVNREIAERRLHSALSKLRNLRKLENYQKIFDEWLELGIIEEVAEEGYHNSNVCYLPHHPVFNEKSSTTPIRPVFDASAKSRGFPSLNNCLEKGQNLLNEIPALLILFRMKQYAMISDVKKAFLQISVSEKDRDYLRFLWYKDGKVIVLRHCRVVFGISSSPFLLAATLNHHLDKEKDEFRNSAKLLMRSIYVDNCVTSVETEEERNKFISESTKMCADAKFELRGWVWNRGEAIAGDVTGVGSSECGLVAGSNTSQETSISVLGLLWNVCNDTLRLDMRKFIYDEDKVVTKRSILAATHQIYDPIGFTAPIIIVPKMLLQELCKKKSKWDAPVPEEIKKQFLVWKKNLNILSKLEIPRWIGDTNKSKRSLHIFTDASKKAYTAISFLRIKTGKEVMVQLVLAKSRVSTIKPMTTPRLELVACECGAKMANYLQKTIDMTNTPLYLWSDSGNALSWIKRQENWQVFVFNRVKTINTFTNPDDWLHIPGHLNPADLPSRGCTSKQLLKSRWWERPDWLRKEEEFWPKSQLNCDERIVMAEKRKVVVSHVVLDGKPSEYFRYFSNLRKIIRMIAWMKRWKNYRRNMRPLGALAIEEENEVEKCLWRMVQEESFTNQTLTKLNAKKDKEGIWRIETKLLLRNDTEGFRRPILLPKNHIAVKRLVQKEHVDRNHCGTPILRSIIREKFWIINARVVTRQVTTGCKRCIRYKAKNMTTPEAPLPSNRVRDAAVFEVVGIDLGGYMLLENNEKSWFVIFTCAVYRAVHLELVTSLSTAAFIQALRRFIARRGRPEVIYTDNGTNFAGTENLMDKLNWDEIIAHSEARRIRWIFNPPSAPWWGGWWERIVGLIKQLLRKTLGRELLDYEEMATILCECEQIINLRPLTYLSEDPNELIPITPMMFLTEAKNCDVTDLDKIESNAFGKKYKHRQEIRQELRERFRKEYLSLLLHQNVRKNNCNAIKVGDVVIVEVENKKRVHWPMARVVKTYPSQDGVIRSVKIRLAKNGKISETDRPIQRLYMLEASKEDISELMEKHNEKEQSQITEAMKVGKSEEPMQSKDSEENHNIGDSKTQNEELQVTRSGRKTQKPKRFGY